MVLEQLNSERFVDASPAKVYATLLDEGSYLASQRTMYRLPAEQAVTRIEHLRVVARANARPSTTRGTSD